MINLLQVKDIKIPEGYVRHIEILANERGENPEIGFVGIGNTYCIWRKPFEFPGLSFGIIYNNPRSSSENESIVDFITNKYGVSQSIGNNMYGYNSDYPPTSDNVDFLRYSPISEWNLTRDIENFGIPKFLGATLRAYKVHSDTSFINFPINASEVPDAEWSISDIVTGYIRLYATSSKYPDGNSTNRDFREFRANIKVAEISGSYYYSDMDYHFYPVQHETDITVEAGSPIITLNHYTGATAEITNIRTDFDEYKSKYEVAGGSQYSKNEYPYLRGIVKLDCKSQALGINGTNGLYITFSVSR